ncbi:MAG: DUF2799 domain-containing protein [Cellvibrionaceae bacterium]|nr:DUF2799 domain-containing protein [Cellvibrionaceae bacterium]
MTKWIISAVVCAGLLAGCGGNVKRVSCSGLDWGKFGYETAQAGESVRQFDPYRDGCGDRLEAGAMQAYIDGYSKGMVEHCTHQNGYDRGYTKKPMNKSCPEELRSDYERGYKSGKFDLGVRVENARNMSEGKGMSEDVEEMPQFKKE